MDNKIKKPQPQKVNRTNAITTQRLIDAGKEKRTLFRNHIGKAYQGKSFAIRTKVKLFAFLNMMKSREKINFVVIENPRFCEFGLHVGSADLIGWQEITVTPEMVGKKIAVFTSEEVKSKNDRMSKDQILWYEAVKRAGGNSNIVKEQNDGSIEVL